MIVCITGGTGYIGSHICISLIEAGYTVICIDNLSNSSVTVLDKIENITKIKPKFYEIDLRNYDKLQVFFEKYRNSIYCVIHCAALKSVDESNKFPLEYYDNNVIGTINLLKAMKIGNCHNMIFSSSATVYGISDIIPITEKCKTNALNAYGRTKLYIEEILQDLTNSDPNWTIISLRYFNPVGAHPSGKIGENPKGIPTNLVPYMIQVASKQQPYLTIYSNNYDTLDGTCIRDYIHVSDVASAHLTALQKINEFDGHTLINIGTGQGYTVMQILASMQKAVGHQIPYIIGPRRIGDAPISFADTQKTSQLLNWRATKTIDDMCKDAWNWHLSSIQ
jgi:UDP-glucose 4-epimerase